MTTKWTFFSCFFYSLNIKLWQFSDNWKSFLDFQRSRALTHNPRFFLITQYKSFGLSSRLKMVTNLLLSTSSLFNWQSLREKIGFVMKLWRHHWNIETTTWQILLSVCLAELFNQYKHNNKKEKTSTLIWWRATHVFSNNSNLSDVYLFFFKWLTKKWYFELVNWNRIERDAKNFDTGKMNESSDDKRGSTKRRHKQKSHF